MIRSSFHTILLIGVLLWCALVVLPPILLTVDTSYAPFADALYRGFSPICHQYDSRSLHVAGHKLAVCSRCTAIYSGFVLGVVLYRFLPRRRSLNPLVWWIVAVTPMTIDVLLSAMGFFTSTVATRLISGGFFGTIAALILTPFIIQACVELIHTQSQGAVYEPEAR